jgi:hypothetical protein
MGGLVDNLAGLLTLGEKLASVKSEGERNALLVEFQKAIIGAQAQNMSLLTELGGALQDVRRLEEQLAAKEDWTVERQRFELRQVAAGVFCCVEKEYGAEPAEGVPKYCHNCFQRGRKSLLQPGASKELHRGVSLTCQDPSCKARVEFWEFLSA